MRSGLVWSWFVAGRRPECSTVFLAFFAAGGRRFPASRSLFLFLLLAQYKRTKEKASPVRRSPGCARRVRSALRGFSDGPSMARRKMADFLSATLTGLVLRAPPPPEGKGEQARKRQATRRDMSA